MTQETTTTTTTSVHGQSETGTSVSTSVQPETDTTFSAQTLSPASEQSLIFELSSPGRVAYSLPECDVPRQAADTLIPGKCSVRKQRHCRKCLR